MDDALSFFVAFGQAKSCMEIIIQAAGCSGDIAGGEKIEKGRSQAILSCRSPIDAPERFEKTVYR